MFEINEKALKKEREDFYSLIAKYGFDDYNTDELMGTLNYLTSDLELRYDILNIVKTDIVLNRSFKDILNDVLNSISITIYSDKPDLVFINGNAHEITNIEKITLLITILYLKENKIEY